DLLVATGVPLRQPEQQQGPADRRGIHGGWCRSGPVGCRHDPEPGLAYHRNQRRLLPRDQQEQRQAPRDTERADRRRRASRPMGTDEPPHPGVGLRAHHRRSLPDAQPQQRQAARGVPELASRRRHRDPMGPDRLPVPGVAAHQGGHPVRTIRGHGGRLRRRLASVLCAMLVALGLPVMLVGPAEAVGETSFTNPLLPNGADPWLQYFNGNYYLATTTWTSQLVMRKSPTLAGLSSAAPVYVWSETAPDRCCNFWAFEFHRLTGPNGTRWYLMYTAGQQGTLDFQRLRVLESAGDDPMGPYRYMGTPIPNTWNIDGTYLQLNGQLYLLYSQWIGQDQSILIAQMSNPWTVTGPHVVISQPTFSWETQGGRTN